MSLASSTGLSSGINYDSIISQLLSLRQRPITQLQTRAAALQEKQGAYIQVNNALLALKTSADSVATAANFRSRTATSNNTAALSASATSAASPGSYAVEVLQLASAHRLGAQGFADTDETAVAAASGTFQFKVGSGGAVKSIAVDASTTLADLRDAINASGAAVTASIINDGSLSNPHRLVLTSKNSGAAGQIFITNNDTSLNFATASVEAAAARTSNTYAGTATSSGTYTGTTSKRFVVEVTTGGALGAAKFRVSQDGGVTWGAADAFTTSETPVAIGDGVEIGFSAGTFAAGDRFEIDAFAPEISKAQDAVVRIDGVTLTRSANTVADAIEGVTLNLSSLTTSPATVTVAQDTGSVRGRIVSFVAQYNEVINQIAANTAYDSETEVKGALLGDSAVRTIRATLSNIALSQVPGLSNDEVSSLAGIGITVDDDGLLQINNTKLDAALSSSMATVEKLFATVGTASSSSLSFQSATSATMSGTYAVSITRAAEQAEVISAQDITGPLTDAEKLTFTVGEKTYDVNLTAGSTLAQVVDSINSQLESHGLAIEAEAVGNRLRLFTTAYGSEESISVKSDRDGSSSTQLGIGTTARTDTGVDVAGTIGGHAATGSGQTLTGDAGSDIEGLAVLVTAAVTGTVGNITVSTGVGVQLQTALESLTDATDGVIPTREQGLGKSVEAINDQIERMTERISKEETSLRLQFSRLETLLSQFQTTSAFLTQQLSNLAQLTSRKS